MRFIARSKGMLMGNELPYYKQLISNLLIILQRIPQPFQFRLQLANNRSYRHLPFSHSLNVSVIRLFFSSQPTELGKVIDLNLCLGLIRGLPPSLLKKRSYASSIRSNSCWIAWLGKAFQCGCVVRFSSVTWADMAL